VQRRDQDIDLRSYILDNFQSQPEALEGIIPGFENKEDNLVRKTIEQKVKRMRAAQRTKSIRENASPASGQYNSKIHPDGVNLQAKAQRKAPRKKQERRRPVREER